MRIGIKPELLKRLGKVALGLEPADVIITGGDVLNVYTGELLKDQQILIAGERIAYVGLDKDFPMGTQTRVIDVSGDVVIPGLIEGHCHMDNWMELREYICGSLPLGTTTIITEAASPTNALGIKGVLSFIQQFQNSPQRVFATAPCISYLSAKNEAGQKIINHDEMLELLKLPEIIGIGEIYWSRLLDDGEESAELLDLIVQAQTLGKTAEGHGAGAKNRKLAAMAASGLDSCHEPITAEEVRERLGFGLGTMIREGSIRRELEAVIEPLKEMNLNLRRAMLVSDNVWPNDLVRYGHMDYIVNKAIALGLDPVQAIQMATLNVAEHFNLGDDLGGIAPGKCADLVVIPDLKNIQTKLVISKGQLVAQDGKMTVEVALKEEYPEGCFTSLKIPRLEPDFFSVPANQPEVTVRAIKVITDILNREETLNLPVSDGKIDISALDDVLKVAVIDRQNETGHRSIGFLQNYGLSRGAVGSSSTFDEGNLVVIGSNDKDMAAVVNRISELKGGIVYCCDGRVVEELPLPIFGKTSDLPGLEVAKRMESLTAVMQKSGCQGENPILTLISITFTAIPALRLTINGYWLAKERRIVNLFV
ncbi:MAG: adenine deaminase C-terminal domain-containing protein [Carboxydocellales bacterium]